MNKIDFQTLPLCLKVFANVELLKMLAFLIFFLPVHAKCLSSDLLGLERLAEVVLQAHDEALHPQPHVGVVSHIGKVCHRRGHEVRNRGRLLGHQSHPPGQEDRALVIQEAAQTAGSAQRSQHPQSTLKYSLLFLRQVTNHSLCYLKPGVQDSFQIPGEAGGKLVKVNTTPTQLTGRTGMTSFISNSRMRRLRSHFNN